MRTLAHALFSRTPLMPCNGTAAPAPVPDDVAALVTYTRRHKRTHTHTLIYYRSEERSRENRNAALVSFPHKSSSVLPLSWLSACVSPDATIDTKLLPRQSLLLLLKMASKRSGSPNERTERVLVLLSSMFPSSLFLLHPCCAVFFSLCALAVSRRIVSL